MVFVRGTIEFCATNQFFTGTVTVVLPEKNLFDSRVPGDSQLCVERAVEGLPIVRFQKFFFSRTVHERLNF